MNWLRRKIRDWLIHEKSLRGMEVIQSASTRDQIRNEGLNFTLHRAVGGHILEARKYNEKTDRHENTLYMIHEDQDFAKQVAQSIMLEQIKL